VNEHEPASGPEDDAAPQSAQKAVDAPAPARAEDVEELRKRAGERDTYLDMLQRCRADFANYQKRVEADRQRWTVSAQRDLIAQLLSASDQCRLAAEKSSEDDSPQSLRNALCLVWSEVEKFLTSVGVTPISAEGQEFDPDRHQALQVQPRDDVPDATVVQEILRGYEFAGNVLRTAQVVVARRPKPPEPPVEPPADLAGAPRPEEDAEDAEDAGGGSDAQQ
jgi:molecular chaperone GrpE